MGFIRKLESGKFNYRADINKSDGSGKFIRKTKCFVDKRDAQNWIAIEEAAIIKGDHIDDVAGSMRLSFAVSLYISKYETRITESRKKSWGDEKNKLNAWCNPRVGHKDYGSLSLSEISTKLLTEYIGKRRSEKSRRGGFVAEQTIKHELQVLSSCFDFIKAEYEAHKLLNPVKALRKDDRPNSSKEVSVRISPKNKKIILSKLAAGRNKMYPIMTELAIETAMRQGEILRLKRRDLKFGRRESHVIASDYRTKKGVTTIHTRTVPLTDRAKELLSPFLAIQDMDQCIWGDKNYGDGLSRAFRKITLTLPELVAHGNFHSTRHEGISRMVEAGVRRDDVMKISGHTTHSQLDRYYNALPEGLFDSIQVMNSIKKKESKHKYRQFFGGRAKS